MCIYIYIIYHIIYIYIYVHTYIFFTILDATRGFLSSIFPPPARRWRVATVRTSASNEAAVVLWLRANSTATKGYKDHQFHIVPYSSIQFHDVSYSSMMFHDVPDSSMGTRSTKFFGMQKQRKMKQDWNCRATNVTLELCCRIGFVLRSQDVC